MDQSAHAFAQQSSSRTISYDEIEELNNILEVERRLVLQTQDNYRQLKEKYIELKEDYDQIRHENEALRNRHLNSDRLRQNFAELEEKSKELIEQLENDGKEREIKCELFKTNTLAELQTVFKKELAAQEEITEQIQREKEELVEENDKLLAKIQELKAENNAKAKKMRENERKLTEQFEEEINKLVEKMEDQRSNPEECSEILATYRLQITELEDRLSELEKENIGRMCERNETIDTLQRALDLERTETITVRAQAEQYKSECAKLRLNISQKDDVITNLQRKLNACIKERTTLEVGMVMKEQRLQKEISEHAERTENRVARVESICKERDEAIQDLRQELKSKENLLDATCEEVAEVENLRKQIKSLESKVETERREKEKQRLKFTEENTTLKLDRNRLEEALVEQRKKLGSSPETTAEIERLKNELEVRNKSIAELRQHYRELLKRMKISLQNLEKKYRRAQQRADSQIYIP